MSSNPYKPHIIKGEEAFTAGNYERALEIFEAVLERDPENVDALNDAGLAAAEVGQTDKAVEYFERTLALDPANESSLYNLLDTLSNDVDIETLRDVFSRYQEHIAETEEKSKYREALFGTAERRQQDPATGMFQTLSDHGEGQEKLNVAFICGPDDKFIGDIEEAVAEVHNTRICHFDDEVRLSVIQELMDWADISWFEWCDEILLRASRQLNKSSLVICRLHRYEVFTQTPRQVNWAFVDTLVFISEQVKVIFDSLNPALAAAPSYEVINNGVTLSDFPYREKTKGFDIAYVGYINKRKNPSILLQCLKQLVEIDSRYRLHIAGTHQDILTKIYFSHMVKAMDLEDHILFSGWVDDVGSWLADKQYLLSTSLHEGLPYNVLEAMSCGVKPIIHNWIGATSLFPDKYIFNTVDEAAEMIRADEYRSSDYRTYIERNYSRDREVRSILRLFRKMNVVEKVRRQKLTYLGKKALAELFDQVNRIERETVDGVIVEAGCALGGSALVIASAKTKSRPFWVYDVFGMIPPPSNQDGADVHERYEEIKRGKSKGIGGDTYYGYKEDLKGEVESSFRNNGYPLEEHSTKLIEGTFEDTMDINESVALAHIDCDWYDSVMTCLNQIEPNLSPGGVIVVDDYHRWSGCRRAVDEYFREIRHGYEFVEKERLHILKK